MFTTKSISVNMSVRNKVGRAKTFTKKVVKYVLLGHESLTRCSEQVISDPSINFWPKSIIRIAARCQKSWLVTKCNTYTLTQKFHLQVSFYKDFGSFRHHVCSYSQVTVHDHWPLIEFFNLRPSNASVAVFLADHHPFVTASKNSCGSRNYFSG